VKNKFIDWSGEDDRHGVGRSGTLYRIAERGSVFSGSYYAVWKRDAGEWCLVPVGNPDQFDGSVRASKQAARKFEQERQSHQPAAILTSKTTVTPAELRDQTTWYRNALVHWPDGINADVYRTTIDVLERAATTIEQND